MNRCIICVIFILGSLLANGQTAIDSISSYKELNMLLQKARKEYVSKENKTIEDDRLMANLYYTLAGKEEERHNYRMSFEYYTNSLSYYKRTRDSSFVYNIQRKIAERYSKAEMYEEALDLYSELLEYYQSKGDLTMQAYTYNDMAKVHRDRGAIDEEQIFLNKAIDINKEINDTSLLITFVIDKVNNYESLDEVDSALMYAFKSF